MRKKRFKIIFVSAITVFLLLVVFFGVQKNILLSERNLKNSRIPAESIKDTISITIIVGDKTAYLSLQAGMSLYDALLLAKDSSQLEFSGKNYPGLGFFVTDIGSLHGGGDKYLFYSINSKEASVGVSSYLLKDGDIIEWKLK